ncbi:MAG: single-stranded DNA-binding protein [Bacteroidales bacterium]|nr:single-stranded DNA-binding protein [Bacteroidales bacterium]
MTLSFSGPGICNLDSITRGAIVHVTGRLKCNRYVDANGNDRVQNEIVARKVEVMKEDRV